MLTLATFIAAALVAQDASKLNEAPRKIMTDGIDLEITEKSIEDMVPELEKGLGFKVILDHAATLHPKGKIISLTLKKGESVGDALTKALRPKKAVWTLWEGMLFITNAKQKSDLDDNKLSAPTNDELKKSPEIWKGLNKEIEIRATDTYAEAFKVMWEVSGVKEKGTWWNTKDKELVGWTAKRTVLRHLRVICRMTIAEFRVPDKTKMELFFTGDGRLFGLINADMTLKSTIANARSAAYQGQDSMYKSLITVLRRSAEDAREWIEEHILLTKDDEKGLKIMKKMLEDLK